MKACFAEQMRKMDMYATQKAGIPSIILMENAAIACVNELRHKFKSFYGTRTVIFCGKGNNGGDGFAIARHLYNAGADVYVYLVCGTDISGDALINFNIIKNLDINIELVTDTDLLKYVIMSADIVIDAIYGTGIHGTVRGISYDVIEEINNNSDFTLSVDIPSGIDADSGEICGVCVNADITVTFAAYKIGMLMFPGTDYTGKVVVADISMPKQISELSEFCINVTDSNLVKNSLPERVNNSHKGDYGKLLIIAGSRGMTGAAIMAAQAALKSGCGLVTLGVCESLNNVMEEKTTEVMTLPLPDINGHFSAKAADKLKEVINKYDAILIGPGIGRSGDVFEVVRSVIINSKVSVVVDADAINLLSEDMSLLSRCSCSLIFTPHCAEMSRMTGLDISYIEDNRLIVSKEFAEEYGATLILKGHHTIVTASDLTQYINTTGNAGLAKGGSGDVLAGITAAFIARGVEDSLAAVAAVYVHGAAGDAAKEILSIDSMSAVDVINCIPDTLKKITGQ